MNYVCVFDVNETLLDLSALVTTIVRLTSQQRPPVGGCSGHRAAAAPAEVEDRCGSSQ